MKRWKKKRKRKRKETAEREDGEVRDEEMEEKGRRGEERKNTTDLAIWPILCIPLLESLSKPRRQRATKSPLNKTFS